MIQCLMTICFPSPTVDDNTSRLNKKEKKTSIHDLINTRFKNKIDKKNAYDRLSILTRGIKSADEKEILMKKLIHWPPFNTLSQSFINTIYTLSEYVDMDDNKCAIFNAILKISKYHEIILSKTVNELKTGDYTSPLLKGYQSNTITNATHDNTKKSYIVYLLGLPPSLPISSYSSYRFFNSLPSIL
ncbi:MAG: hypothetical protein ACO3K7_04510 [Candidatus Marinamargulisbacteria bacterium]